MNRHALELGWMIIPFRHLQPVAARADLPCRMSDPQIQISDNASERRYELHLGGKLAGFAEYRPAGADVMFSHTEIEEGHQGQGLGSRLVEYALKDVRVRGQHVVPMCPFVASFIREHREYVDLVQPGQRAVFGL